MPTAALRDPHWAAADLLEHARLLARLVAARPVRTATTDEVVAGVCELHARCVTLEVDSVVAAVPARRRARLAEALDRLACASDDLASIVLLRCTGAVPEDDDDQPDVASLLDRVAERHDHVVSLLGRAGIRRSAPLA